MNLTRNKISNGSRTKQRNEKIQTCNYRFFVYNIPNTSPPGFRPICPEQVSLFFCSEICQVNNYKRRALYLLIVRHILSLLSILYLRRILRLVFLKLYIDEQFYIQFLLARIYILFIFCFLMHYLLFVSFKVM